MITIILAILFGTFQTIKTNSPPCASSSNCQCSLTSLDDIKLFYKDNIDFETVLNVESWDNMEVICNGTHKLEDFNHTSILPKKKMSSLSIHSCILSDKTSLEKFVTKLGIVETEVFCYRSSKTNKTLLTRDHLKGISNVKGLILSHNGLYNISKDFFFDFPQLEMLDISHNNLTLVYNIFNANPNLKYLDLYKCHIYLMSPSVFSKLEKLEHLDIGHNRFIFFPEEGFFKLVSLKSFSLKATNLKFLPEFLLRDNKNLESIDISHNSFVSIPEKLFSENKNLRRIYLHNNNISMVTLPDHFFSNLEKLEEIHLNNDGLLYLPEILFSDLSSLKYLNLGNNNISYLRPALFEGLKNLEVLKLNNNLLEMIPDEMFIDLEKLKTLDMSMNNFYSIQIGMLVGLTSLTELNMENNHLRYIHQEALISSRNLSIAKFSNNRLVFGKETKVWSPFYNNHFLKELHLSNNTIEDFFTDWSINYELKYLNLSQNKILTVSKEHLHFLSNQIVVDLSYNQINNILLDGIDDSAIYHTKKRPVIVILNHNPILCDCYLDDLIRYLHNEMHTSVYNYIEIIAENLTCVHINGSMGPKIQELNSSTYTCSEEFHFQIDINCPINCTCSLRPKDKTRILDCSNKNMSNFVMDERSLYFVNSFPVILNLTGNNLTSFPTFNHLKHIKWIGLLLSNNNISEIEIDKLPQSLKKLELHNNNISKINSTVIKYLNSSSLNEFTLSENPILCDCDAVDLFVAVQLKKYAYEDLNKLKCKNMDVPMRNTSLKSFCSPVIGVQKEEVVNEVETIVQTKT